MAANLKGDKNETMNIKALTGSALAAALLGLGVLAGSVVGSNDVSAQTATTQAPSTQAATPQATPSTDQGSNTNPHGMMGGGGKHGFGGGGRGDGFFGGAITATNASQQITNTSTFIDQVKSDLAYANGKMDTADVQKWVDGASALLQTAQTANSNSQYGQAIGYAQAARELAETARSAMAQKLGATNLPSYSQAPQGRGDSPGATSTATLTQAQASRILAQTYDRLVSLSATVKGSSQASAYLTDAQNAYKAAYNSYQSGNYSDAAASARVAGELGEVAQRIVQAATAPADSTTPVTVPAPNF